MSLLNKCVRALPGLLFFILAVGASTPTDLAAQEYQPQEGQAGKDVVWVPMPDSMVDKMLDLAKLTPKDYLIDLGSGDGRTIIFAAKRGVRAHGVEYNPDLVELSKRWAAKEGVGDKATFAEGDLFAADLSKATVITLFLLPDINLKLRPRLLDLRPGTRVLSNTFTMGEWTADETVSSNDDCSSWCTLMLWIIPAKVEGRWKLPDGELTLKQTFQTVSGSLKNSAGTVPVVGKLRGDQIVFSGGGRDFTGRVAANRIEGIARAGGKDSKFSASRATR
jgi:hypothetical protein